MAKISKLSHIFVLLRDDIQNSVVTKLQQGRGQVVRLSKFIVNFRSRVCYRNVLYARITSMLQEYIVRQDHEYASGMYFTLGSRVCYMNVLYAGITSMLQECIVRQDHEYATGMYCTPGSRVCYRNVL